ncbi:MAG: Hsp70 family protein, partial [Oscillospiraceae bacterium]|nr:Hsp70 family protein [Oscillospiraceae bacterium]
GVFTRIIDRNTTIPTRKSQIFYTADDNQTSVEVNVLQGERELARDNKLLGIFHLDGIAPAPRGIPQIEVTFDIDANGIVSVSAQDKGTGKQQSITITSSTNMSKEDIEKAVKEAEQFAEEDKKRKEEIETKNHADTMVYQTEKLLKDMEGKISDSEKSEAEAKKEELKTAIASGNTEDIKAKMSALESSLHAISQKMYEQAAQAQAAQQQANGGAQTQADDGVVDAEFKDVD